MNQSDFLLVVMLSALFTFAATLIVQDVMLHGWL